MAAPYPHHPLLSGPFEPIRFECDYADLVIEGEWPAQLHGALYRIGPNPQYAPIAPYDPLQGEGMVHAFFMRDGRVAYRNRWVRTRRFELERSAARALFATGDRRGHDASVRGVDGQGAANTNVVMHAGRLLALEEGHPPVRLDPVTLATLGPWNFAGRLPGAMTAHPKIDPVTGEMFAFTNFPDQTFDGALLLHAVDASGDLVWSRRIAAPYPALVHDFALTARHIVLIICPTTLSLDRVQSGEPPIAWEPACGAFIGLLRRDDLDAEIHWRAAPITMAWHVMNAYEDRENLYIDLCPQAAAAFPTADGHPPAEHDLRQYLTRWTLDLSTDAPARARRLSDVICEYPRIDERRTGRPYRYGYVATDGGPGTADLAHHGLGRFDHEQETMTLWRAPLDQSVSEPIFAPAPHSEREDCGWVLATVFDAAASISHLAVFDAHNLTAGPVARAHLGHRVPAGFHGSFVAAPP